MPQMKRKAATGRNHILPENHLHAVATEATHTRKRIRLSDQTATYSCDARAPLVRENGARTRRVGTQACQCANMETARGAHLDAPTVPLPTRIHSTAWTHLMPHSEEDLLQRICEGSFRFHMCCNTDVDVPVTVQQRLSRVHTIIYASLSKLNDCRWLWDDKSKGHFCATFLRGSGFVDRCMTIISVAEVIPSAKALACCWLLDLALFFTILLPRALSAGDFSQRDLGVARYQLQCIESTFADVWHSMTPKEQHSLLQSQAYQGPRTTYTNLSFGKLWHHLQRRCADQHIMIEIQRIFRAAEEHYLSPPHRAPVDSHERPHLQGQGDSIKDLYKRKREARSKWTAKQVCVYAIGMLQLIQELGVGKEFTRK